MPSGWRIAPAAVSLVLALTFIVCACALFSPRWETNDDVSMAMVAHGFGLALHGSPNLVFSNVLWGYLVRAIPTIDGILGYSLATLAVLATVAWALTYYLIRLGAGYPTAILAMALVLLVPTLFPQFTLNSGLLAVAAVLAAITYARHGDLRHLVFSCLLAFAGFLVRYEEFVLVAIVALPLLPWSSLRRDRWLAAAIVALAVLIGIASIVDRRAYQGPEWQPFLALDAPRAMFTDYNAGEPLLQRHPEILLKHGYSKNDLDLIGNYFFVDPNIANPTELNAMLRELGPLPNQPDSWSGGIDAVQALFSARLLPLLICGVLLAIIWPSRKVIIAWTIFVAAIFAIGVSGRPGFDVLRIYVPILSLLVLAPLVLAPGASSSRRQIVAVLAVAMAIVWTGNNIRPQIAYARQTAELARADIAQLPTTPIAVWGNAFPYTAAYPVLSRNGSARQVRLYALGTDTLAPYSVSLAEQSAGRGFVARLRSGGGLDLVASDSQMEMLSRYCGERLAGTLATVRELPLQVIRVRTVRCESP